MNTLSCRANVFKLLALLLAMGSMTDCLARRGPEPEEDPIDLNYSACLGPARAAQTRCLTAANQWANFCLRYTRNERPVEYEGTLGGCYYGLRQRKAACGQQFDIAENQCNLTRCQVNADSLAALTQCSLKSACTLNRINRLSVCEAQNSDVFITTYDDYRFYHLFATAKRTMAEAEDALENAAYLCKQRVKEQERQCLNP